MSAHVILRIFTDTPLNKKMIKIVPLSSLSLATFFVLLLLCVAPHQWSNANASQLNGNIIRAETTSQETETTLDWQADENLDRLISAERAAFAPSLAAGEWFNSEELKLEDLRGQVVLIDFWSFSCGYCRRQVPALRALNTRYRGKGLKIIGVHSPMIEADLDTKQVRRVSRALRVSYPVVIDNDKGSWRAFRVRAYPTVMLLDKKGRIRFVHIGDGYYRETERAIRTLLDE